MMKRLIIITLLTLVLELGVAIGCQAEEQSEVDDIQWGLSKEEVLAREDGRLVEETYVFDTTFKGLR